MAATVEAARWADSPHHFPRKSTSEASLDASTKSPKVTAPNLPQFSADIIDIRRGALEHSILDEIFKKLQPIDGGEKGMPTLLLYDEAGLKLFEDITYLEEYYLTNDEIEVLQRHAGKIADGIQSGSMVIELGSGNLRKVNILLQALEQQRKNIDYFALDLSLPELHRTLSAVPTGYQHVKCYGLHGTYDDGLEWLKLPQNLSRTKCILSLGSSVGNFTPEEASGFLKSFAQLLKPGDTMLVGLDACKSKDKVFHAYNDRDGVTHDFIMNGLTHANNILRRPAFKLEEWKVIGEYDEKAGRHQAFYSPLHDTSLGKIRFSKGEKVRVEESYKYSAQESLNLWHSAELFEIGRWGCTSNVYHLHMLAKMTAVVDRCDRDLSPRSYAAAPVPGYAEWTQIWATWDKVTLGMIPKNELLSKPIDLRNACIFYLGHIPTFLDIQLNLATKEFPSRPNHYRDIFERGIDPDVDNPEKCHAHSEAPDTWPSVREILEFQSGVRSRVESLYKSNEIGKNRKLQRALWLAFDHEAMHLETLIYMLLQSNRMLPPPGVARPDFAELARNAALNAVPNDWFTIPATEIVLGLDDPQNDVGPDRFFGWDNEVPARRVKVASFQAKARPITNGEYAKYLEQSNKPIPASWAESSLHEHDSLADVVQHHLNHGQLTNGHLTNGQPTNGQLINGHLTNGHLTNGQLTNGQLTNGHPTNVHIKESTILTSSYLKNKSIKTVWGQIPLIYTLDWPVIASYNELAGCASWMNGRIPTMEEVRSIYQHSEHIKTKEVGQMLAKRISGVNGQVFDLKSSQIASADMTLKAPV
ncbi:MAG: hypothetical protein M1829_004911 [Trizodia sp. TS-e1964]|nr:MAG: hypothetical protein M1829_004911 [Trizodia sp. TS-e1964]